MDRLGSNIGDADDIFSHFQNHWTDEGGHAVYGIDWWFDGTNDSQGETGWSQVDVTGGGGFYSEYDVNNYLVWSGSDLYAMRNINAMLLSGYATSLGRNQ